MNNQTKPNYNQRSNMRIKKMGEEPPKYQKDPPKKILYSL